MMMVLANLASIFVVLMTIEVCSGSPLALPSCPAAITDQWDELTKWDKDNLKLTLDIEGVNCSFNGEAEVEVFAVKDLEKKFDCEDFEDSNIGYKIIKFFDGRDSSVYILSDNKPKIIFEFISGWFVFRIGNKKIKRKHCTSIKSYTKKDTEAAENNSALYYREKCSTTRDAEIAPRQPRWNKNICSLEIPTFQLPQCFLITNYTTAPVYLVQIDDKNKTCLERGNHWELNPAMKDFNFEFQKTTMLINKDTQIKDIRFTNLEEKKKYCIFISMWETYPICNRATTDDPDLCYFFSTKAFKCPPKPTSYEKQIKKAGSPMISVAACGVILVVCAFFIAKVKRKIRVKLKTNSVMPMSSSCPKDEDEKNSKIYLLYYPNDEVTEEDIKQVIDENGSLCKNLLNICSTDTNVTIVDIVDKIRLDEIQDTSVIELDLSSGVAKCVLILTPSAKKLFDHIASGGNTPNPLDRDVVDGSVRNVILPLFKHIINIQNINMNTYQTIGCVRFDRNDSNDGDEIQINPLVRMSLPSDGREFAEWAIHNS